MTLLMALLGTAVPAPSTVGTIKGPELVAGSIRDADYPRGAISNGEQGSVHLALLIGPDGEARSCIGTAATRLSILPSATCRMILNRFKYVSARDATGTAVQSVSSLIIHWKLNQRYRPSIGDFVFPVAELPKGAKEATVKVVLATDERGAIFDCAADTEESAKRKAALVEAACKAMRATGRVPPAVFDGKAVPAIQSLSVGFLVQRPSGG